jgi:hypothetical protein
MLLILISLFPIFAPAVDYPIDPVPLRQLIEAADCIWVGEAGKSNGIGGNPDDWTSHANASHSAYTIPMPLRQLVVESDLIIAGVAGESTELEGKAGYSRVGFEVGEVLQGSWGQPAFSCVYYSQWTSCGQMEIKSGSGYLIFVELLDDGNYKIHGLESGAVLVNDESLTSYRNAIGNLQLILHIKNKQQRNQAILEWLVCITVDPHTRWDGAYDLSPGSHYIGDFATQYGRYDFRNLNADQVERLWVALENVERIDDGTEQLYDLFARQWSPRKLPYLLTAILSWNSAYQPRTEYLAEALLHCKNEKAQALFDRYWPVEGIVRKFKGRPTLELAVANKIGRILKAEFEQKTSK